MTSFFTAFINLELPEHGTYQDQWEIPLNANAAKIDALFSDVRSDVGAGTGHVHNGVGGQGPRIQHSDLLHDGYDVLHEHEELDEHVDDATLHFELPDISLTVNDHDAADVGAVSYPDAGWNNGPGGVDLIRELRFPNARAISSPEPGVVLIDTGSVPAGGTGPGVGVPDHLPATYAPVAVTDYFNGPEGEPLSRSNWWVDADAAELRMLGQAAVLRQETATGGAARGRTLSRVKTQVPHSEVQRVTLYACRIDVDSFVANVDLFTFQLALMASQFPGVGALARLGLFLRIDCFKQSGQIHMTRTIYAVPSVDTAGNSVVTTLWSDTGPVTDYRHYQGAHEFSLDRQHAFHYVYNNGPVAIGSAGAAGAATPYLSTLRAQLLGEFAAFPQTAPRGVAPQFGRFGFDVAWAIPSSGVVECAFEYFTATSTDDEALTYQAVKKGSDCALGAVPPAPLIEPCCVGGPLLSPDVDDLLTATAPTGSPAGTPDETVVVASRILEGDPLWLWAGFLVRPFQNATAAPVPIFCELMGLPTVVWRTPPRSGARDVELEVLADRIPGYLDVPHFSVAANSDALALPLPAGAGAYPQAVPWPDPAEPGGPPTDDPVGLQDQPSAAYWSFGARADRRLISNIRTERTESGRLRIRFDLAEAPFGAMFDLTLTSRLSLVNQLTAPGAVVVLPPQPVWRRLRWFRRTAVGVFVELTELAAGEDVYVIAYGVGLPLPIVPAASPSDGLLPWSGYPFDVTDLPDNYRVVAAATGLDSAIVIAAGEGRRGEYDETPTYEFPPVNMERRSLLGQTLFLRLTVPVAAAAGLFALRAVEPRDGALTPADAPLPVIAAAVPAITSIAVSPDTTANGGVAKTVTVTGRNFDDVTVALQSGAGVTGVALVSQTPTTVVFTAVTATAALVTFRLTNASDLYVDASWTVGDAQTPSIITVSPAFVVAADADLSFFLQADAMAVGVVLETLPILTVRDLTVDLGLQQITFSADAPAPGGGAIVLKLRNPNGNESAPYEVPITTPAKPCPLAVLFYESLTAYTAGTADPLGAEVGRSGYLKVTGTGFRAGLTVTASGGVILGEVTVVSVAELRIVYSIPLTAQVGYLARLTATDRDGVTDGSLTFTLLERTPTLSAIRLSDPHEGAGAAGQPAGSAKARISGRYFTKEGVTNIASVTASGFATVGAVTVLSDSLLEIASLALAADSQGETVTLTVTTIGGRSATISFVVLPYRVPLVSGWTVHPGAGLPALQPLTVPQGSAGHRVRIYGSGLKVSAANLTGPFVGVPVLYQATDTFLELSLPTLNGSIPGDPTVRLVLTPFGTSETLTVDLFQVDVSAGGTPVVDTVDAYELIEGSPAAVLVLQGEDLGANLVGSIELVPLTPRLLPRNLQPIGTLRPTTVQIRAQTTTEIRCVVAVADLTAGQQFRVRLYGADGAVRAINNFNLTVQKFPDRPKFTTPLPVLSVAAGNANDVTYDLDAADGGERLQVYGGVGAVELGTGDPLSKRVTFTMSTAGTEGEVRLVSSDGRLLDVHRFSVTA